MRGTPKTGAGRRRSGSAGVTSESSGARCRRRRRAARAPRARSAVGRSARRPEPSVSAPFAEAPQAHQRVVGQLVGGKQHQPVPRPAARHRRATARGRIAGSGRGSPEPSPPRPAAGTPSAASWLAKIARSSTSLRLGTRRLTEEHARPPQGRAVEAAAPRPAPAVTRRGRPVRGAPPPHSGSGRRHGSATIRSIPSPSPLSATTPGPKGSAVAGSVMTSLPAAIASAIARP